VKRATASFSRLPSIAPTPACAISRHPRLVNSFFVFFPIAKLARDDHNPRKLLQLLHINSSNNTKISLIQIRFPERQGQSTGEKTEQAKGFLFPRHKAQIFPIRIYFAARMLRRGLLPFCLAPLPIGENLVSCINKATDEGEKKSLASLLYSK
jgi:hypothetical protein